MSEHLSNCGVPHLVLERHRVAERWRPLKEGTPGHQWAAWHDRFPGMAFTDIHPDAFTPKERVADYFAAYAEMIEAPVRCGVEVTAVQRKPGETGFLVDTSDGTLEANHVVAATGPFQRPIIPTVVPESTEIVQLHSNAYRNPEQLPDGAVLVVGAGSSGSQIANELMRAGRRVYLSVGPHSRPPRSYRGIDFVWWLGVLGKWDAPTIEPGMEHVTIAVSGAYGGETIDFRRLAASGMTLVGRTETFERGVMHFASDLADNIARGDANHLSVLDEADAYIARNGLDFPDDPEARRIDPTPECVTNPIRELNIADAGISSIVWATGFQADYSWLKVNAFDELGRPEHHRGLSTERGIYFVGLPWLSSRSSSFIWGVWHDAKFIAEHIAIQRNYLSYVPAAQPSLEGHK